MIETGPFTNKRVLITGGLGFIGSNLARRLILQQAEVTLIDGLNPLYGGNFFNIHDIREKVSVDIGDVRDISKMSRLIKDQDYLFNLAGQTSHVDSMKDPKTDLDINAAAQLGILEICRTINPSVKIVFASTRQIYGKPDYLPVDESHPIRPVDVNGINKVAGEWYHLLYNNVYGIRSSVLRLTNTYGPGMRVCDARQTFLGIWIRRVIEGQPIDIFGDGLQLRDFTFVSDCVEALMLAAANDHANGKVYNLGGAEVINLKSLAEMLGQVVTTSSYRLIPFPPERNAIDIGNCYCDYSRFKTDLGWIPKVLLLCGLTETVQHYQKYHHHYWSTEK